MMAPLALALVLVPGLQALREVKDESSGEVCGGDDSCYAKWTEPCADDWEFKSKYHYASDSFVPIISKIRRLESRCLYAASKQKTWTKRDDLTNCGTIEWVIDVAKTPESPIEVYRWKSQASVEGEDSEAVCKALLQEKNTKACKLLDKRTDIMSWNAYGSCEALVADTSPDGDAGSAERAKAMASFANTSDLPDMGGTACGEDERCYVRYPAEPCKNDWVLHHKYATGAAPPIISYIRQYETKCLKKLGANVFGKAGRLAMGWTKRPDLQKNCGGSGLVVQAAKNPSGPQESFAWAWKEGDISQEACEELLVKKDKFCDLLPRGSDAMGWNMFNKCVRKAN